MLTDELLSRVYEHPVRVVDVDGGLVVVPVRARVAEGATACAPS